MSREILLLVLLVLTAYRLTRLIVKDTFPPVLWVRDRVAGGWRPLTDPEWELIQGDLPMGETGFPKKPFVTQKINDLENRWVPRAAWSPYWLAELMTCPWCASAYVSGALVLATDLAVGVQWPWLMGCAVWAGASLIASKEWA